jgi:hypothetical protein|tara:strand:+ start:2981 stop:3268 length:288 start_codon:yes stop_codon:yes gene_type:complete
MKKLLLTTFVLFSGLGILFAGDGCVDYASVKDKDLSKTTQEIVLTSNNLQLLKYSDHNGTTRFTIQNLDGTVVAEDMSRLELRIDFPEIEKKFES